VNTPWGKSDEAIRIARGLTWVSTPSHGGFLVGRGYAQKNLTPHAIAKGERFGSYLAYEEDCAAAIILWEVPQAHAQLFPKSDIKNLYDSLSRWNADYLLARDLKPAEPGYSEFLQSREEDRLRDAQSPDLIVAAQWDADRNFTIVHTADDKQHRVPTAAYDQLHQSGGLTLLSKLEVRG
jgi:uncharacterized protein DUF7007